MERTPDDGPFAADQKDIVLDVQPRVTVSLLLANDYLGTVEDTVMVIGSSLLLVGDPMFPRLRVALSVT